MEVSTNQEAIDRLKNEKIDLFGNTVAISENNTDIIFMNSVRENTLLTDYGPLGITTSDRKLNEAYYVINRPDILEREPLNKFGDAETLYISIQEAMEKWAESEGWSKLGFPMWRNYIGGSSGKEYFMYKPV